jgi:hypothetical protein
VICVHLANAIGDQNLTDAELDLLEQMLASERAKTVQAIDVVAESNGAIIEALPILVASLPSDIAASEPLVTGRDSNEHASIPYHPFRAHRSLRWSQAAAAASLSPRCSPLSRPRPTRRSRSSPAHSRTQSRRGRGSGCAKREGGR